MTTIIDNPPVLSSKYPLLESIYIETSNLKTNPLRVIILEHITKEVTCVLEDNELKMSIYSWDGRGKIKIKISSSGHLRYDRIKQNLECNTFIRSMLESLSDGVERYISSSSINVCRCIAKYYEYEFVSAVGDLGLTFFWFNVFY